MPGVAHGICSGYLIPIPPSISYSIILLFILLFPSYHLSHPFIYFATLLYIYYHLYYLLSVASIALD
jgi:hypothetical protein